ncbi:hypothetical protein D9613_009101 [Agrocybe pediades]|uniref:Methyltransferase domain-containing protein n=1 Tax=Agrocybe pediades TaxID=84607 RepID=A0A8H4R2K5_9AGAR|nr:hypothetical protein D9613_009101 [Agrocybe pediades]
MSLNQNDSIAEELSRLLLVPQNGMSTQIAQVSHRLTLIDEWGGVQSGVKIVELGCGQGDCTIALANAVGERGLVNAIDPAPPSYGAPFTVRQAQQHITSGALGKRINWIAGDPLDVLSKDSSPATTYDIGILAHCLWYFSNPSVIRQTFERLGSTCKRVYVAEWALSASKPTGLPHVFAALTQASLECRKPQSDSNVRTVSSPAAIRKLAEEAGLKMVKESTFTPNNGLLDGKWEVSAVASAGFVKEVEDNVKDERERSVVFALRDSVLRSLEAVGGRDSLTSMDVWCAVFERA